MNFKRKVIVFSSSSSQVLYTLSIISWEDVQNPGDRNLLIATSIVKFISISANVVAEKPWNSVKTWKKMAQQKNQISTHAKTVQKNYHNHKYS